MKPCAIKSNLAICWRMHKGGQFATPSSIVVSAMEAIHLVKMSILLFLHKTHVLHKSKSGCEFRARRDADGDHVVEVWHADSTTPECAIVIPADTDIYCLLVGHLTRAIATGECEATLMAYFVQVVALTSTKGAHINDMRVRLTAPTVSAPKVVAEARAALAALDKELADMAQE
jgi:hypothetical protein